MFLLSNKDLLSALSVPGAKYLFYLGRKDLYANDYDTRHCLKGAPWMVGQ